MRAIKQFIIFSGIDQLNVTKQIAMGFDGRIDFTLNSKNRFFREEHLTFVDKAKLYIPSTIKTKNLYFSVGQKVLKMSASLLKYL